MFNENILLSVPKNVPITLKLNFEAVISLISEISGLLVSLDLYCLYGKSCNLTGCIIEHGPSIHFRTDSLQ